jgi:hypothetical protein
MFIGCGDRLSLSAQRCVLGSTHSDAGVERFDIVASGYTRELVLERGVKS